MRWDLSQPPSQRASPSQCHTKPSAAQARSAIAPRKSGRTMPARLPALPRPGRQRSRPQHGRFHLVHDRDRLGAGASRTPPPNSPEVSERPARVSSMVIWAIRSSSPITAAPPSKETTASGARGSPRIAFLLIDARAQNWRGENKGEGLTAY
jgi:hypothetical protein